MDYLDKLAKSDIKSIELFDTKIEQYERNYREKIFHKIKSLEAIDGVDREGYHVDSDFVYSEDDDYEEEDNDYEMNENGEDEFDEDFD